jgi:hypothetical protein
MTIKDEYSSICRYWQEGMKYGDIHAQIVDWVSRYKTVIRSPSLPHLISRLYQDEMTFVVNDFIFGHIYADLRNEMAIT